VAVAVAQHSVVVLDEADRVVEAVSSEQAGICVLGTSSPLEELPSARTLFAPHFERARRTRQLVEFREFVDGRLVEVSVMPDGARLVVSWRTLDILDVLTIEGLRESLRRIVVTLEEAECAARRAQTRAELRLIDGGA
jgi:hypothetical protein